ncbi:MAG: helix-hairpin-helix domain-containing protein [Candidatus Omnitrophota bacterium]|jgi:competence protein ComEA
MLNLTQEEKKVVLFLAGIALLGMVVSFGLKQFGAGKTAASFSEDLGKVDLNRADKRVLLGISGIGEKLAQRIIDYRDAASGFNGLDDLKNIKGINDSKFAKIKEYLIVK